MLRTIFWFIYFGAYLLYSIPSLWKANKLFKNGELETHKKHVKIITRNWARSLLKVAGIKVHIHGKENIPKMESCLIVSNHQGNFDIPILLAFLDVNISFISKIEVKKLPIIRTWMEHMECVFMDRKDRRQSIQAIRDGVRKLEKGNNIVIFPEGTRSKGGPVANFKTGSIKLATLSNSPILPITIDGSYLAMEANNNFIQPAEVHITISTPIRIHLEDEKIDGKVLTEMVQKQIESNLNLGKNV
ncbi:lysophospholipid acyltransferase family protein [Evansella sp. AB-rgal1]|uniref:lysophospholipid acyltransferase family protein n=1 Tax=Evansella sp. AB-rgal1 TaxID=3242696 RepID=UPI00359E97AD